MPEQPSADVPWVLFADLSRHTARARIVSTESGVVAGVEALQQQAGTLGLQIIVYVSSGSAVQPGDIVAVVAGNPVQVVRGEDCLLGTIAKVSGVATAARTAVRMAGRLRVVSGGWKKMPAALKEELRDALRAGGLDSRIVAGHFVYLDKNYVRILGSVAAALECAGRLPGRSIAVQLRGETSPITDEAVVAARGGARVLMVDTGRIEDLREVSIALMREDLRRQVEIAFAGNLTLDDLDRLQDEDVDVVDIGRAILDAPMLDFRYDVFDISPEARNHQDAKAPRHQGF